ncbi:T9SS sorting signal type C domain-containing protein [Flavobacterium zepuense]|uniref:T9SS sorting signal type C domain-containing protein n=1 Tax=Flavobacterium zepuense TaxID=2593302 RepID=A0A552UVZ6_9FLAO|nr:T9SS sorting signal type C domain-containing protein [Flavobacterium zepuense]TRW22358.1 T9SS sorting signal type C domain-containing protein [Flavobacterium zepuense]
MIQVYQKITANNCIKLALLTTLLLLNISAKAQTCTPQGNQTAYGQNQWLGYVYNNIDLANPPVNVFVSANYKGYITRTDAFDQNIGDDALPAESTLCTGTYNANFGIRYKMQKTLPAGWYTYTVNADDGYRLSVDGGQTFPANLMDWADHGFQGKSATYYHAGGVLSLVYEYYEHGGASRVSFSMTDAACTTTAPTGISSTGISSTGTSSCTTTTTLTATGGVAGTNATYQWGTGTVAGTNIISGATTASIAVQPLSTKTYWVRRVAAAPCSNTTDAAFAEIIPASQAPGNPTAYGNNVWNVYGYKGKDINLGASIEYAGYYTTSTLGFDSTTSWPDNGSPSTNNAAWNGCTIPDDNFTFVHKRQGFPCGNYTVRLLAWDDDVVVYINGTAVYSHNGYSGGVGAQTLGTYNLDANSTIEVRVKEDGGGANAKLSIVSTTTAPTSISGTLTVGCGTESTTLTAVGGASPSGDLYEWGTGSIVGENIIAGATGASITVSPPATTKYWVRRVTNTPCYYASAGVFATVVRQVSLIDPSIFGTGKWNVYAYNGTDINTLSNNVYRGYYTTTPLNFDSAASWAPTTSPSTPIGNTVYTGCTINADNFTFVHKRTGFNCATYTISMVKWDDNAQLYIDGVMVWSATGYSGDADVNVIVGTYQLTSTTKIELRTTEINGSGVAKIKFTAVAAPNATAITGPSVVCKDSSVTLTATGTLPANSEYQWGTGSTGSNIIAGQTGASIVVAPGTTTTYWVRIKNTICDTYSSGITKIITVPAAVTYTASGWSATPTITTPVDIEADLDLTTNLEVCSCRVKNTATVVVNTGATLTVKRKLTVDPTAAFFVHNNAALVQIDNDVTNEGKIKLTKNSNPLFRLDYTMWSSPVSGQNIATFSPFTAVTRFYTYGGFDANNEYKDQYFTANVNNNFDLATGYLIRMPNSVNGTTLGGYYAGQSQFTFEGNFTGVPYNGTQHKELHTLGGRYTAVGNPYASPISVKEFYTQNAGVLDASSGMYFWRKKNDYTVSTYATLTLAAFVANAASPDGTTTPTQGYVYGGQDQAVYFTGSNSNNNNWAIAPGQGFIVKTKDGLTNPQVEFNNTMRKPATISQSFFKVMDENTTSRLWLNLSSATSFSQIAVAYIDGATLGLDFGYDGKRLGGDSQTAFYSTAGEDILAIQARPTFDASDIVPLGFVATDAGVYNVTVDHVDGVFANGQVIYLKDKLTGAVHNVTNGAYTFTTEAGTFNNRFEVVYEQPSLGVNNPVLNTNSVIVYQQGGVINITSGNVNMNSVTIYDIRGRKLYAQDKINNTETAISNLQAQHEVLIVEINTTNGTVSKKIIF